MTDAKIFGIICLSLSIACFPNTAEFKCALNIYSIKHIFLVICVNACLLITTTTLTLCHLFNIPEASYRFSLALVEKFHVLIAFMLYGIGMEVIFVSIPPNKIILPWMIQLKIIESKRFGKSKSEQLKSNN
ncbi:unnamed protein product [Thelazia callipaeda]|uniref:G-protein coupled receptors family 1 profile domain-containing protein n=1 Tax=Thelazia callipaeda TaxID=103827 RepID=A0A0N5CSY5_THECL|nr:unnamed protein product [Thelazia callipaeda]